MATTTSALTANEKAVATLLKKSWISLAKHEKEFISYFCGLHTPPSVIVSEIRRQRSIAELAGELSSEKVELSDEEWKTAVDEVTNGKDVPSVVKQSQSKSLPAAEDDDQA